MSKILTVEHLFHFEGTVMSICFQGRFELNQIVFICGVMDYLVLDGFTNKSKG